MPFQFDDFPCIVENPAIRDLASFARLLSPAGPGGEYPLLLIKPRWVGDLSFALDHRLWGLDPRGYHLTNLLIHLCATGLVYRLGLLLLRAPRLAQSPVAAQAASISWWAAAAFALHPLQTQAVTYIVQRYASLATMFVLLAAVSWFEARNRWGRGRTGQVVAFTVLSVVASAAAMVTKEMVVTAPVLIAVADAFLYLESPSQRLFAWLPLGLTPGLALAGALTGRPLLERLSAAGANTSTAMGMTHADFLLTEVRVVATYLRLLVWPTDQNLFWDYPIEHSPTAPGVLVASALVLGLLAFAALLWVRRRAWPALLVVAWSICWFFGALVIESGAVLIIDVINEHRLYYPLAGASLGVAVAGYLIVARVGQRFPSAPRLLHVVGVLVLLGWAVATTRRNSVWASGVTLWEDSAAKSPKLPGPLFMVGLSWERDDDYGRAAEAYQRALVVDPRYFPARLGLRSMCSRLGRTDCALHASAMLAFLQGDHRVAAGLWQRGLQANPRHPEMHYGLGLALEHLGESAAARDEFDLGCRLGSQGACQALAGARPVPGS